MWWLRVKEQLALMISEEKCQVIKEVAVESPKKEKKQHWPSCLEKMMMMIAGYPQCQKSFINI